MQLVEALLIVLIIVVLFMLWRFMRYDQSRGTIRQWDCVDRKSGALSQVNMEYKTAGADAIVENLDYFDAVKPNDCDGTSELYAREDYADVAKTMAVESSTIKSHHEFVMDRLANGSSQGRTFSPDSHDSYDAVSWVGIRGRPQRVAIGDPTQVPDIDLSMFPKEQRLRWT